MRPYVALFVLPVAALRAESAPSPVPPASSKPAASAVKFEDTPESRAWSRQASVAIVANVDGRAITSGDIANELMPIASSLWVSSGQNHEKFRKMLVEQGDRIRDELKKKYLILSEANEKGMKLPASVVQEQIDEKITTQFNGDRNEYMRMLNAQGRTPLDDRKATEEDMMAGILSRQNLKTASEISPAKIQRFYEANKDGFSQPAGVKLSEIILWPGAADTDDDVRKSAARAIAELDKGVPFTEVAKKYSKDESREQGGESDWRDISQLSAPVAKVVTGLKDGQHTKPIEFMVGGRLNVYIYRRDASREAGARPLSEVREIIERKLVEDSRKEQDSEWFKRLENHFFVRYYDAS